MPSVITVYEQSTLRVGPCFSQNHFEALSKYHDQVNHQLFSLGHRSIRFFQFVGILGIGDLILEVLPKLDSAPRGGADSIWRGVLCDMLAECGTLQPRTVNLVRQSTSRNTLLDMYIAQFIGEIETLLRRGLAKGYRAETSNVNALRGRLDFPRHISRNGVCADRWFTEHSVYDRDNPFNGILKRALELLGRRAPAWSRNKIRALLLEFEGISPFLPTPGFIARLRTTRNTERYRPAIELAWMIIRNHAPNLGAGHHDVFALMFDMNKLFEEYLFLTLHREGRKQKPKILCTRKENRPIWRKMHLSPDIVARVTSESGTGSTFVLDAKWKCPVRSAPIPSDLRQVLAYNLYFNSRQAFLVYPSLHLREGQADDFRPMSSHPDYRHRCEVHFVRLIDDHGRLCKKFAPMLLQKLVT